MDNEIKLTNVSYSYRNSNAKVLKQVSCTFRQGKVNAIIGTSGSGKTTLLSLIAGLDKPKEGEIYYNNQSYSELDLDSLRRENISMIFQNYNLLSYCTVLENVGYPMEMVGHGRKESEQKAKEYLSIVGIDEDKYKRFPSTLSGGEQQRVAIARALASGTQVILADEPTGNLDEDNGSKIIEIFHTLAHHNKYCIILVTHNLTIANQSDVVFHIKNKQIIQKSV